MKLTIDRFKWLVGESPFASTLLRKTDGKMCCLGFYCLSKGATQEEILEQPYPSDLPDAAARFPEVNETKVARSLALANDKTYESARWTMAERESHIASIFKSIGVDVEFVGEHLPQPPCA